jgi:hypothetical protein
MNARSPAIIAIAWLLGTSGATVAQQLPPRPPSPAALSVPHPIPPVLPVTPQDLYQRPDLFRRLDPQHRTQTFVYGPFPMYVPSGYMPSAEASPKAAQKPVASGGLRLETEPGIAQVYVDGFYVGVVDDFGISGRALDVEAGPHRVELRAAGYATLAFSVSITPNQTVRFRGDLQPLAPPPQVPTISAPPKTVYVIPNCYAGDRPPTRVLPPGCSIDQMRVSR